MKRFRDYRVSFLAGAAFLLLTPAGKGQFQAQTFSNPRSYGGAFSYHPYQLPFRMPPGNNYAYVNPNGGTYNYAPRFYQPSPYLYYAYNPFYTYPPSSGSFTVPYAALPSAGYYNPFYAYPPSFGSVTVPYAAPASPGTLSVSPAP